MFTIMPSDRSTFKKEKFVITNIIWPPRNRLATWIWRVIYNEIIWISNGHYGQINRFVINLDNGWPNITLTRDFVLYLFLLFLSMFSYRFFCSCSIVFVLFDICNLILKFVNSIWLIIFVYSYHSNKSMKNIITGLWKCSYTWILSSLISI